MGFILANNHVITRIILLFFIALAPSFATPADQSAEIAKIQSILPAFEETVNKMLAESHVPGAAIAIVSGDNVVLMKGYGVADLETKQPIQPDTTFLIGSISKMLTSQVFAALVAKGKTHWDEKVSTYLPDFTLYDPIATREITLRDLLSHRSGLSPYSGDTLNEYGYDKTDIIKRLRYIKPTSRFRSHWDYQNIMFITAGKAAEKMLGKHWNDIIAENIFRPLDMNASSTRVKDFENAKNKISLYQLKNGNAEKSVVDINDSDGPAGGVNTTLSDFTHWMIMVLNNGKYKNQQIIDSRTLQETQSPQIFIAKNTLYPGQNVYYGLGAFIEFINDDNKFIEHGGALSGGIQSYVKFLPEKKVGIVIFTNAYLSGLPEAITYSFYDLYFNKKLSRDWLKYQNDQLRTALENAIPKPLPLPPKNPAIKPSVPLVYFSGLYHNDYIGDLSVAEHHGKLTVTLNVPKQFQLTLEHWNGDTFVYEKEGKLYGVTFARDHSSNMPTIFVDGITQDVQPIFKRLPGG